MPSRIWITNSEQDPETGAWKPAIPAGTSFVGNLYEKNNGNVRKFLIKTPWTMLRLVDTGEVDENGDPIVEEGEVDAPGKVDLTGLPGVFGPIDPADIQAALESDKGVTRGWTVDDVPDWAVGGVS